MLFQNAVLGGLLLAGHTMAKVHTVLGHSTNVGDLLRRDAEFRVTLSRREDANAAAPQASTSPDVVIPDMATWNTDTKTACMDALSVLHGQASNPTGLAVCYNLRSLDNQTGIFQADVRMYNVSAPIDPWGGVSASDVAMILSYQWASVQMMNTKREAISWPPIRVRRENGILSTRALGNIQEMKVLSYVGKINSDKMSTGMTEAQLMPMLVPEIDLVAKNRAGQDVKVTISSQEASFVNGVFAQRKAVTAQPAAAAAATNVIEAPFILPGTSLAFFPIGLVITSIWMGLFFLVVGFGTYGRMQFRDQYRRRMKREMATATNTI